MTMMEALHREALPDWPRLMSVELAARYLGLGATTLREMGPDGPKPKRYGKRVLYDRRDLDRWADALDGQPLDAQEREAEGDAVADRVRERLAAQRTGKADGSS
jgi:hypothetical protein